MYGRLRQDNAAVAVFAALLTAEARVRHSNQHAVRT